MALFDPRNGQRPQHARAQNIFSYKLTDDQGTLDANCYGAKHLYTPHMDALAECGIRFTRAYSHTVCCPARANLLTGCHAQRTGINHWTQARAGDREGINIHADEVTAAEIFKQYGYRTGLFGKWHLGAAAGNRPLDMGFDEFFGFLGGFIENYTHYSLHGRGFHDLWDGEDKVDFMSDNGHSRESYRIAANHESGLPEGWFYGAHGAGYTGPYKGEKNEFTEGGIRVPYILKAPGRVPASVVSDHVLCGLDWVPTVLSLCGIDYTPEKPFDGIDASASLSNLGAPAVAGEDERVMHFQWGDLWAVMRGDWKLIGSNGHQARQLLNLADESPETVNYLGGGPLQPTYGKLAESLEAEHTAWLADVRPGYEVCTAATKDKE